MTWASVYVVTANGNYIGGGIAYMPPRVFANVEAVGEYIRSLLVADKEEEPPLDVLHYSVFRLPVEEKYVGRIAMLTEAPKEEGG